MKLRFDFYVDFKEIEERLFWYDSKDGLSLYVESVQITYRSAAGANTQRYQNKLTKW